jgi:hypothetical protein
MSIDKLKTFQDTIKGLSILADIALKQKISETPLTPAGKEIAIKKSIENMLFKLAFPEIKVTQTEGNKVDCQVTFNPNILIDLDKIINKTTACTKDEFEAQLKDELFKKFELYIIKKFTTPLEELFLITSRKLPSRLKITLYYFDFLLSEAISSYQTQLEIDVLINKRYEVLLQLQTPDGNWFDLLELQNKSVTFSDMDKLKKQLFEDYTMIKQALRGFLNE